MKLTRSKKLTFSPIILLTASIFALITVMRSAARAAQRQWLMRTGRLTAEGKLDIDRLIAEEKDPVRQHRLRALRRHLVEKRRLARAGLAPAVALHVDADLSRKALDQVNRLPPVDLSRAMQRLHRQPHLPLEAPRLALGAVELRSLLMPRGRPS